MAEENMAKAREVYDLLCRMLDNRGWHYDKIEDKLVVKASAKGDDLPIDFIMKVHPKNEIVSFYSSLPFTVSEAKRIDLALAVCVVNAKLVDGSFDYDLSDGTILFRLTSSFRNSTLSEELFEYMLIITAGTVDEYNDKFFMIAKDMLPIQKFIESESN